ncbi:MAG: LysR family transcriptional regulator [Hyphomicrobiaceae bacterium]|nr:LysR family transcriptional regulator [Hyphomicrobiaceae bacterium]
MLTRPPLLGCVSSMNLKQIETFIWIARLGSFAAASQRLNTTQSAISTRIQELELDLGVQLFVRGRRAASLTAKGHDLLGRAEALMEQVWDIQTSVGEAEQVSGIIRMGVADLIALTWLGDLVKEIHANYRRVKLDLQIGLAMELVEKLRGGELDIVLAPGDAWRSEFSAVPLGHAEFLWMARSDFDIPDRALSPRDLQQWPIITLSSQSYHHRLVNQWFRDNKASSRNYIECNSIGVIASLTADGLGIGLIPTSFVSERLKAGELRIVTCDPQIAPVGMFALFQKDCTHPLANEIASIASRVSPLADAGERIQKADPALQ